MRIKLLTALLMAGAVVGCSSNPPPPAPMAAEAPPPPAPPPAMGPVTGRYRGMVELASDAPRGCAKYTRPMPFSVLRNNSFVVLGMRGMIGADGAITSTARGGSITGTASNSGLDMTVMKGKCSYHVTAAKA